jgi:hypothetical protein
MKKSLLISLILLSTAQLFGQRKQVWTKTNLDNIQEFHKIRTTSYSENQEFYRIDLTSIKQSLQGAADKFSGHAGVIVEFPNSKGTLEKFLVWENSNFAPAL